jgi:hypothetical protein
VQLWVQLPPVTRRAGATVELRQVHRQAVDGTQFPVLTSRTDLPAAEVCWRLSARWRPENYFKYARAHFALDALDSYADTPDDPTRPVPNPAKAAQHAGFQVQPGHRGLRRCEVEHQVAHAADGWLDVGGDSGQVIGVDRVALGRELVGRVVGRHDPQTP